MLVAPWWPSTTTSRACSSLHFAQEGVWTNFNLGVQRALADNRKPLTHRWHYMSFSATDHTTVEEWEPAPSARAV